MSTWRNRPMTLNIEGFNELLIKLQAAGKNVDFEVEKCFSQCCKVVTEQLTEKAKSAGLDERLISKIQREKWHKGNTFYFEVGWKKAKPTYSNPIPDTYKVMFYNYGTPSNRYTKAGYYRGKESAHPIGSHGFIKKAKIASQNKCKKIQREFLAAALKELK